MPKIHQNGGFSLLPQLLSFDLTSVMRRFLIVLLCLCGIQAGASHIVGGEFELIHVSGSTYRLNLIIYFDNINGAVGAKDETATVSIFRKSKDTFISSVVLPLVTELRVDYTQPECSSGEIVTDKLFYSTEITLDPAVFKEPEGYYVVWERCCRNYNITNIFSENPAPQVGGIAAGQTFLLEFPAVVKNGKPFINSSPRLFPPLNDYACPNRPYYVDFAGIDDDGDSLVYSLTTPLGTHSSAALPNILPRPYPTILWRAGFDITNIINGNPDLRISKDGLLTATPLFQGLYVFAVKVEEYRKKELIGISRRDFQMLVVDRCADALPPEIEALGPTSLSLTADMTGSARCVTVRVRDPDSERAEDGFAERVRIRAIGLNFENKNLTEILPAEVSATLSHGSFADFTICFPVCPFFLGGPNEVGIIAMDDACSLPLLDTLKLTVNIVPPLNTDPYFVTALETTAEVPEGQSMVWNFEARDDDGDELVAVPSNEDFDFAASGFTLDWTYFPGFPSRLEGQLSWDASCDEFDFTQQTTFPVKIAVNDVDECNLSDPPEVTYILTVIDLPENNPPIIDTNLTLNTEERFVTGIQRKIFQNLSFNVTGKDEVDNGFLVLSALGSKALKANGAEELSAYGITFEEAEGQTSIQSQLNWKIQCENINLDTLDLIDIEFMVLDDANFCRFVHTDTVEVQIKILPPDNAKPQLIINNLNSELTLRNSSIEMTRGTQLVLGLQGADADNAPQDLLKLELIKAEGNVTPSGFIFSPVEGLGSVSTTFSWNPDCSIFENGVYENDYTFTFSLNDRRCFNTKADTVAIELKIKDIDGSDSSFTPINYFSPNGDGYNDYYAMEAKNKITGLIENILPLDNCASQFQAIRIYNRWGKEVFKSTDRNFRWFGDGEASGVYYYLVQYSNREYKGALSIRY